LALCQLEVFLEQTWADYCIVTIYVIRIQVLKVTEPELAVELVRMLFLSLT